MTIKNYENTVNEMRKKKFLNFYEIILRNHLTSRIQIVIRRTRFANSHHQTMFFTVKRVRIDFKQGNLNFMSFEIEKKFKVLNHDSATKRLESEFKKIGTSVKMGFWWTENEDPWCLVTSDGTHKISKKNIETINKLTELKIPEEDFQFIRLRILDNEKYIVTLKNKAIVNNIEQNVEYEYECEEDVFRTIAKFLSEGFYIFYYNVKTTTLFTLKDVNIELSKFNDLKNSYLEVEVTGSDKTKLESRLDEILKLFDDYPIVEEPENYNKLSRNENARTLENKKLKDYSKEALKLLQETINFV